MAHMPLAQVCMLLSYCCVTCVLLLVELLVFQTPEGRAQERHLALRFKDFTHGCGKNNTRSTAVERLEACRRSS